MRVDTRSAEPLACQRHLFSLARDVHWLNCAYMSPLAKRVEAVGIEAIRRKSVPTAIGPHDFFADSMRVRELFADLIHAPDPSHTAILPAASYGMATCARNLTLAPSQNVVVQHEQFPGNIYTWRTLCERTGATLRVVRPDADVPRGEVWTGSVLDAIDSSTAVVSIGTVHWTDGTLFDLEAIGDKARSVGAAFILDGTQSVGALPFDVRALRPDALIVAGYKWLMGPYSIGLAWYGPRFDEGEPLEETWIARQGSENFSGLVDYVDEYQEGMVRFDVGERSNFILLPMLCAALEMLLEWRPHRVQRYLRDLSADLLTTAKEAGFGVEDDAWRPAHLFGLRAPEGVDLTQMAEALSERGIYVSRRGNALRVSPHVYNDAADVGALAEVLRGG